MSDQSLEPKIATDKSADGAPLACWWVAIGDKVDGPHTPAFILELIEKNRLSGDTMTCLVGQTEWRPLYSRPEFAGKFPPRLATSTPVEQSAPPRAAAPSAIARFFRWITNPELPHIANAICVYCLFVYPLFTLLLWLSLFWGTGYTSDLPAGSPILGYAVLLDFLSFLADCGKLSLIVLGGFHLSRLRRVGPILVIIGFGVELGWNLISGSLAFVWAALVTLGHLPAEEVVIATTTGSGGFSIFFFVCLLLIALAFTVFEIASIVWLCYRRDSLPLKSVDKAVK